MFRATVSLRSLNQLDAADKYLKKAMDNDPHNRDLLAESARLREARESLLPLTDETPTVKESTIADQYVDIVDFRHVALSLFRGKIKEIDDLLSAIAVSDAFHSKAQSILMETNNSSEPLVVQRQHFTPTEYYYVELLARRQRLQIERVDDGVLHIRK